MKYVMFSIRDNKAAVFMPPFHSHNRGTAIRSIQQNMLDENSSLAAYPEDFDLFEIGTFDDETGSLEVGLIESLGPVSNFNIKKD